MERAPTALEKLAYKVRQGILPASVLSQGFTAGGIPGLPAGLPPPPTVRPTPGVRGAIERTLPGGRSGYEAVTVQQPTPGIGGAVARMLPGGKTGWDYEAVPGAQIDRIGRPVAVVPVMAQRLQAPPGYVIVTMPNGEKVGVLKGVARAMGLYKGRPKPPVSAGDMKAIRRAARAQERVKKLGQDVGLRTCKPKSGSSRFPKKRARKR